MNLYFTYGQWGIFRYREEAGRVCEIRKVDSADSAGGGAGTVLSSLVQRQLGEYFLGRRRIFTFPVCLSGTEFQKRILEELLGIPYGETRTYGELARAAGCPGGARAAGAACRRNPLQIVVPCHRVVGADGKPGGYAGGPEMKKILLELEKRYCR